jgi:hypothetical protein
VIKIVYLKQKEKKMLPKKTDIFINKITLPSSKKTLHFRAWTIQDELDYEQKDNQVDFLENLILEKNIIRDIEVTEIYWLLKEIRKVSKICIANFNWQCKTEKCGLNGQNQENFFDFDSDVNYIQKKQDFVEIDKDLIYYFKNLSFIENLEFINSNENETNIKKLTFNKIVKTLYAFKYENTLYNNLTEDEKREWLLNRPNGEWKIILEHFKDTQNIITLSKKCKCIDCKTEKEIVAGLDFLQL